MTFTFVSGNPALDLVGTVLSRQDEPVDLLGTPADLERWVLECDELPDRVTADDTTFEFAVQLREAIHQLALDRIGDRRFTRDSLATVNDAARGPALTAELGDAGSHLHGDLRTVSAHIARSAVGVLGDQHAHVKQCSRPGCTRIYLDRSRGARRTWCGMDSCGNRVKAAAYRARRRAPNRGAKGE